MEPNDLFKLPLIALILCCPFVSIYLTLKLTNWNQQEKLFSNSWLVYIVWMISCILVWCFSLFYGSFSVFFIGLLILNTLNIATTLLLTIKVKKIPSIAETERKMGKKISSKNLLLTSFAVNFSAILTVIVLICMTVGVGYITKQINPPPPPKFAIYD